MDTARDSRPPTVLLRSLCGFRAADGRKIEVSADGEILQYFVQTTISRWFITSLDHEVRFATQSQTCPGLAIRKMFSKSLCDAGWSTSQVQDDMH